MEALTDDPAGAVKWLLIFVALGTLYFAMRKWEKSISGKIEEIKIQQPIEVVRGTKALTEDMLSPALHRVATLETRMTRVEAKMESDKEEILAKIDGLNKTTNEGFRAIERALGRLEGKP